MLAEMVTETYIPNNTTMHADSARVQVCKDECVAPHLPATYYQQVASMCTALPRTCRAQGPHRAGDGATIVCRSSQGPTSQVWPSDLSHMDLSGRRLHKRQ